MESGSRKREQWQWQDAHIVGRSRCTPVWCEQAEMDMRGQQDVVYSEAGALGALVMDYVEEDRGRPKR